MASCVCAMVGVLPEERSFLCFACRAACLHSCGLHVYSLDLLEAALMTVPSFCHNHGVL